MRIAVWLFTFVLFGLPSISHAQQSGRTWVRRITLAAACAASAWDIQTTAAAVGRGGREGNGWFADPVGRPRWGRMIGFKAGLCGGLIVSQELRALGRSTPWKDHLWTGLNTGMAARFTFASLKNRSIRHANRPATAAP